MSKGDYILSMDTTLVSLGVNANEGHSVKSYIDRVGGKVFTLEEHIEAMMLSLLSANRPWKQIWDNKDKLKEVFHNYDITYLQETSPKVLMDSVCSIGCGNRAIMRQMQGVSGNVNILLRINDIVGLENLVTRNSPYDVSNLLSSGYYKLNGFAQTLALQYLRNVGIDTCKPDVHIRRILARIGIIPYEDCPVSTVLFAMEQLSEDLGRPITLINEIVWAYGATGYGEVCTKVPRCYECNIKECSYRRK